MTRVHTNVNTYYFQIKIKIISAYQRVLFWRFSLWKVGKMSPFPKIYWEMSVCGDFSVFVYDMFATDAKSNDEPSVYGPLVNDYYYYYYCSMLAIIIFVLFKRALHPHTLYLAKQLPQSDPYTYDGNNICGCHVLINGRYTSKAMNFLSCC